MMEGRLILTKIKLENNMKDILCLTLLLLIWSCMENEESNSQYEFIKFISEHPMNPTIVIPAFFKNKEEYMVVTNSLLYDYGFKKYVKKKYSNYTYFFIDIIEKKIKLDDDIYTFFEDRIVKNTRIYSEYEKFGIDFIIEKYLKSIGYTPSGNKKYYGMKRGLSFYEKRDLARILFLNEYLIMESDIDGSYSILKFTAK